jgi:Tol biopolymer transport system component
LIFSRAEQTPTILSLELGGGRDLPTVEVAPGELFGTSRDGRTLVYKRMLGMEKGELVVRDRNRGIETVIAVHQFAIGGIGSLWPQVSPDGTRVIYRAITNPPGHYLVSTGGGPPKFLIAREDFNLASDWFPDGKRVIGECLPITDGICELDPEVGKARGILKDPQGGELLYPSFSWDGTWVAFMRRRAGRTVISVTPVRNDGSLAGEAEWVQISSDTANASRPRFSPDGSAIFYEVVEGSIRVLVKQRVDPVNKRPMGELMRLATVRQPDASIFSIVTVTRDRVFFNTLERHSNLWMTQIE